MKIILYATCSFSYFYREMILRSRQTGTLASTEWKVMLYSWRHLPLFDGLVAKEDLFYVPETINRLMKEPMPSLDILNSYSGSMAKDIAADKDMPGQLRRYDKDLQLKSGVAYYQAYKDYLLREKPDYIFMPLVETHEGMVLLSTARELGIPTIFRSSARSLRVTFFSIGPNEDLPRYVVGASPDSRFLQEAKNYVDEFRRAPAKAWEFVHTPSASDIIPFRKLIPVSRKLQRIPIWFWNLIKDVRLEPHSARPNPFFSQPRNQFWWLTRRLGKIKGEWRRHFFDVFQNDPLPKKFIYFPLHVWPELSVTSMSPYFENPLRAIDLIRFHMPADHWLIVKEHPAMRGERRTSFYRALRKRAGVLLADFDVPSLELIQKASLTATITGTAAFEALLLGKPSLVMGDTFFSPWIPKLESMTGFGETMRQAMQPDPDDIYRRAVDCVSRILAAGYDFVLFDPHDPEVNSDYTMNWPNMDRFLDGLKDHLRRLKETSDAPPESAS